METLIGIGVGIFLSYAIFPKLWSRVLKAPCSKVWSKVKSIFGG